MNEQDIREIIAVLRQDINLGRAGAETLTELAWNVRRLHCLKGEYVFRTGDDADSYLLVESGRVVLSREAPSGKVFTFRIAVRGTPLNAVTCFRARTRFFSARVAEEATLLSIPCAVFRRWVLENAEVAGGIISTMGDLLDTAYARIVDLIDESAEKRVLNVLDTLSSRIGPELPLTNADVAELVGTSRETAARIVSRLQEAGLIAKSRGTIRVLDRDRLDELSSDSFFIF